MTFRGCGEIVSIGAVDSMNGANVFIDTCGNDTLLNIEAACGETNGGTGAIFDFTVFEPSFYQVCVMSEGPQVWVLESDAPCDAARFGGSCNNFECVDEFLDMGVSTIYFDPIASGSCGSVNVTVNPMGMPPT